jgi:mannose-6-phosphate isomerase class I
MAAALRAAQDDPDASFPAGRFVRKWPARRHDHFLIPAGTPHGSGAGAMVLEISATPFLFTFKLWDWGRVGLDGRLRPIHLDHGLANIQWERDEKFVERELINRIEELGSGDGWREERTGLHPQQFIETRRHFFTGPVEHDTCGGVNVLNLVQGRAALVTSPTDAFLPFEVHYAETFIVPASVGRYDLRPQGAASTEEHATVKARVRE